MIVATDLKATGTQPAGKSSVSAHARAPGADAPNFGDAFAALPGAKDDIAALAEPGAGLAAAMLPADPLPEDPGKDAGKARGTGDMPEKAGATAPPADDAARAAAVAAAGAGVPLSQTAGAAAPGTAAAPAQAGAGLSPHAPPGPAPHAAPPPAPAGDAPAATLPGQASSAGFAPGLRGAATPLVDAPNPARAYPPSADTGGPDAASAAPPTHPERWQPQGPATAIAAPPGPPGGGAVPLVPPGDTQTTAAPPAAGPRDTMQTPDTTPPPVTTAAPGPEAAVPHPAGDTATPAGPTARDPAPGPPAQAAAATEAVLRQVAGALIPAAPAAAGGMQGMAELALSPPELGSVRMVFATTEAGLNVLVTADRPETQDLLRRNADLLLRDLRDAGHDAVTLDFSGGGDGAQTSRRWQDTPDGQGRSPDAAAPAPPSLVYPSAPMPGNGRLNLRM